MKNKIKKISSVLAITGICLLEFVGCSEECPVESEGEEHPRAVGPACESGTASGEYSAAFGSGHTAFGTGKIDPVTGFILSLPGATN